ncbi:DegT/DnrJ/EryC1/StrS family aminotransferase [Nitrosopumilus adriaticus]|uniref:Glutamine--scyllo-inositol transaminase n=1 Tax=Nitrosopumilus adriaticus TaxID=1580092 RepID=A0A0D5C4R8_9ARCH|nr:DegT/DnrJ/EryC1/StrS family aminotransferase [Nitrosopumilus adriaticus]AJW71789.1 Glutamine--scyllo-inositol transaminase [Nitrosopumilus adriaticus]
MSKIKLFDPFVDESETRAIKRVLDSHFWASGAGSGNVKRFEMKFAKYIGSKNCVAVNSGTAALNLALSMIDIKGKEVILPSLSFVSTANAVIENGGIPKFVDIEEKTLCIDYTKICDAISKKTKIILPVHFAGYVSNLEKIASLCKKFNIDLIEDAAHAAGSSYNNKKIGSHGKFVCFSFHPVKNLAMPTGGLIAINQKSSSNISRILKAKRWCGITNRRNSKYDIKDLGWNYYMNEFSAAIGLEQLKKLDWTNKQRQKNGKRYFNEISIKEKMPFDKGCSYHFYWIRVKNRQKFRKKMFEKGIETGTHYEPIHKFSFYKSKIKLPITEKVSKEIVTLPTHPNLSDYDIDKIIKTVNGLS